jgi:hypothetical protein
LWDDVVVLWDDPCAGDVARDLPVLERVPAISPLSRRRDA